MLILKLMFIPCRANNYKPKFLESDFLFYLVVFLLALKLITIPFFIYFPKSAFFADLTRNALIELTNQERESLGIPFLDENPKLNEAAYLKAMDMMEKDYFSHQNKEGLSPWYWFKQTGYDYEFAGENLAIGFLDSEEVHQAWLNSFSHKENLLNPYYKEVGIAVLKGDFQGNETTVVVQLFGAPHIPLTEEKPEQSPPLKTSEEKLSIENKEVISYFKEETKQPISFQSINYYNSVQIITYTLLILLIASLVISVIIRPDIQHKDLIIRTIVLILILISALLIDKETVIQLIPHNLNIY